MGISLGLELSCEMGDIRESRFISVSGDLLAVGFIETVLESVRVSRVFLQKTTKLIKLQERCPHRGLILSHI